MTDSRVKINARSYGGKKRYTAQVLTPRGKWISAGTKGDKMAAMMAAATKLEEISRGAWVDGDGGKSTLRAYVTDVWLPSKVWEQTTRDTVENVYLPNWILAEFGDKSLASIKPVNVQTWVATCVREGKSPATIRKVHGILHNIFATAVHNEDLARNPCAKTSLPTVPKPKVKIMAPEDFDRMIEHLDEAWLEAVLVDVETGMRLGELRALCPAQIDFLRREIRIDRAVSEVKSRGDAAPRFLPKQYTKDGEPRTVPISESLATRLSTLVAKRGLDATSEEPLFRTTRSPYIGRTAIRAAIQRACRDAKVPPVSTKHLRASYASWLLAGGADVRTVQDLMGHSSMATTQFYATPLPDAHDRARDAFQKIRNRSA